MSLLLGFQTEGLRRLGLTTAMRVYVCSDTQFVKSRHKETHRHTHSLSLSLCSMSVDCVEFVQDLTGSLSFCVTVCDSADIKSNLISSLLDAYTDLQMLSVIIDPAADAS